MLALLPLDPGAGVVGRREPALEGTTKVGLTAQPGRERDLGELDAEPQSQLAELLELVQLAERIDPVAAGGSARDDETVLFEVAEHPRRPPGAGGGVGDGERLHIRTLTQQC